MAGGRPTKPRLYTVSAEHGIVVEKSNQMHNYEETAKRLCAFIVDCLPSGALYAFARETGASPEKVFDIGIKELSDVHQRDETGQSDDQEAEQEPAQERRL